MPNFKLNAIFFMFAGVMACSTLNQKAGDPSRFTNWVSQFSQPPVVAVLPFKNQTDQDDLPELVRVGFYGHLAPQPFRDLEIRDIDRALELLEKHREKSLRDFSSQKLGSLLGAHLLIYGEVTEYTKIYTGVYSQIGIGAKIKIVEAEKGKTIWEDFYSTRFHEGSIPMNQVTAVFALVKTVMNLRNSQELRTIDDLCRNLTARIPEIAFSEGDDESGTHWCEIQVAAFKDFTRAQNLQKEIQSKQYAAFIRTIESGGVFWHRVLLGPFDCGEETDEFRRKIADEFGLAPIPVKVGVFN